MSSSNKEMVNYLKRFGYIKSSSVEKAFLSIDRTFFVMDKWKAYAYEDTALPFYNATISAPGVIARMLEMLEVKEKSKVLEIGTGSAYSTCLLSILAKKGSVVSIEIDSVVFRAAQNNYRRAVDEFGIPENVTMINADGKNGYSKEAPYDRVIVNAATRLLNTWVEQLKEDGIIVFPKEYGYFQRLAKYYKGGIVEDMDVVFLKLV